MCRANIGRCDGDDRGLEKFSALTKMGGYATSQVSVEMVPSDEDKMSLGPARASCDSLGCCLGVEQEVVRYGLGPGFW